MCGIVAAPVVALAESGPSHPAVVTTSTPPAAPPTDPVTVPSTTSTTSTTVAPTTTTVVTVRSAAPATTPTTVLVCHNSFNPACGPFHWSSPPAPAGTPTVSIHYSPQDPVAGDTVNFTVTYSDPDTSVAPCGSVQTGTPLSQGCAVDYAACPTRYGPWDPPARHPGSNTLTYTVKYDKAQDYTFSVDYGVGTPCYDPYQGHATGSITVPVRESSPTTS